MSGGARPGAGRPPRRAGFYDGQAVELATPYGRVAAYIRVDQVSYHPGCVSPLLVIDSDDGEYAVLPSGPHAWERGWCKPAKEEHAQDD